MRIPKNAGIGPKEEVLAVTVTYETQKLYGKVTAQKRITVYE